MSASACDIIIGHVLTIYYVMRLGERMVSLMFWGICRQQHMNCIYHLQEFLSGTPMPLLSLYRYFVVVCWFCLDSPLS